MAKNAKKALIRICDFYGPGVHGWLASRNGVTVHRSKAIKVARAAAVRLAVENWQARQARTAKRRYEVVMVSMSKSISDRGMKHQDRNRKACAEKTKAIPYPTRRERMGR